MDNVKVIDFNTFIPKDTKVLTNRDVGAVVRKTLKLDTWDKEDCLVHIKIPSRLYAISSSFFLGCFEASVKALGVDKFRKKYIFKCDETLMRSIDSDIYRASMKL